MIYTQNLPWVHPSFSLLVQFRASVGEVGDKQLAIRLVDADGKEVIPEVTGTLTVSPPPEGSLEAKAILVAGFANTSFPRYGDYTVFVCVDSHEMARIPFRVVHPPTTV